MLSTPTVPMNGLTDAELRATPVPVSGTVSTGGLTDAQLRATPVDTTTDGLTDAQLRATPVSVSITNEDFGTFSYVSETGVSSGVINITGRVINIRLFPVGADAAFNINAGDTITIRQYSGFDLDFKSPLTDPAIHWVSGTFDLLAQIA